MSSKAQYLSYPDVIRTLNEKEISHDLSAACSQSALSTLDLLARFDHVASLLHAIDLAEASAATAATPIKPGWLNIRKVCITFVRTARLNPLTTNSVFFVCLFV